MSTRQPKPWTPERHEACKARAAAATRGPWKWWTSNSHRRLTAGDGQDGGVAYGTEHRDGCGDIVISESDMAFTESAREDVPDMLAEIESLWNEVNHLADDRDRLRFIAKAARTFVNDPHSARTFEVLREALDDDRATPTNEHDPDSVSPPGETLQETLDALRNRLRLGGPLTEETKRDIRQAFANLCGAGVPEEGLAHMLATHAIGLLENQQPEWFAKGEK